MRKDGSQSLNINKRKSEIENPKGCSIGLVGGIDFACGGWEVDMVDISTRARGWMDGMC